MLGLIAAGVSALVLGLSVARGVQARRQQQNYDTRLQMTRPQLISLLETQVVSAVKENRACSSATAGNRTAYEACQASRVRRLLEAAAGTATMIEGIPVFRDALKAMAEGADDDPEMAKVVKSGETWPGTTIPILQYIENATRR